MWELEDMAHLRQRLLPQGSETVGLLNQPSVSIRQASVAASGRHASVSAPEQILSEPSHEDLKILPRTSTEDSEALPRAGDGDPRILPRASDDDSQPVDEQGDRTLSPSGSDDTFGSFPDAPERDDSLPNGGQQRDDARHDQDSGERQRDPRLHLDRPFME